MKNFIGKSNLITITDDAHCLWVYTYLRRRNWLMAEAEQQTNAVNHQEQFQQMSQLIIASLDQLHILRMLPIFTTEVKKVKIREMLEAYKNSMLSAQDLRLIRGVNDRVINAFWIEIKSIQEQNPNTGKIQSLYNEMPLPQSPVDTFKRRECLIQFFNLLEWSRLEKLKLLDRLQTLAKSILNFEKAFRWLNSKDSAQCDWAHNYVKKRITIESHIDPIGTSEKYSAALAVFDSWSAPLDSKKLFLLDIRRAWSQKKHREKLSGKKPYNFIMNKGLAKKLDVLSKKLDLSKNELVEKLIESEFSKHFQEKLHANTQFKPTKPDVG